MAMKAEYREHLIEIGEATERGTPWAIVWLQHGGRFGAHGHFVRPNPESLQVEQLQAHVDQELARPYPWCRKHRAAWSVKGERRG